VNNTDASVDLAPAVSVPTTPEATASQAVTSDVADSEPAAGAGLDGMPADGLAAAVVGDTAAAAAGGPAAGGAAGGVAVKKAALADIEEAMKDVVDPELGINVVDLGLVYGTHVDDDNVATIDMTLTSAACPLTDVIEDQARSALCTGPGGGLVNDIRINWVWLPPWGPDKITDEGRDQLRALGFNV
jgi:metal-sulfur cluster biosynthetic enzyme